MEKTISQHKQLDSLFIELIKMKYSENIIQYFVKSGNCMGIATYYVQENNYIYQGDNIGHFYDFVKNTLIESSKSRKILPNKITHGYG